MQQPSQQTIAAPVPAPAPIPATTIYPIACEAYRSLVSVYQWNVDTAMQVMKAESGCNPAATGTNANGTTDAGLFQINSIHCDSGLITCTERYTPGLNIQAAYQIYIGSGWRAWSVCTGGKVVCNN